MKLLILPLLASLLAVWTEAKANKDFPFCLDTKWAGSSPCFPSSCPKGWIKLDGKFEKYTNLGLKKQPPFAPAKCEASRKVLCCDPNPCPVGKTPSRPKRSNEWDLIDALCLRYG